MDLSDRGKSTDNVVAFPKPRRDDAHPCRAKLLGPFLGSDATYVVCGREDGHEGSHTFYVFWTDAP